MNFSKLLTTAILTGSLFSCQGSSSGDAPSAAAAPQKDYNAMAVSMATSVLFVIPTDSPVDCFFDANVVPNGQSVPAFQNSSVPYGSSCVVEQRTCQSGSLSGSFNYATCIVDAPASCLFNGQTIPDGAQVNTFANSAVSFGQACVQETRICHNGVLSGSYAFNTCDVAVPAACLFNGQSVSTGQSVPAFLTSSVPFGQTCTVEYRTCTDGILSGSNTYANCNVGQPAACLFNGQEISNGQSVTAFVNSSAPAGSVCNAQERICNNGVLSGSNAYATCQVSAPENCLFNGQTIAHGSSVNAFAGSAVAYGELCSAELRLCDNGHLSGSFQFASCDQGQPASCLFNGQTVPDGASVTAFAASTVASGSLCSAEARSCANGVLSGAAAYASCEVAAPASCLFNGQTIVDGQTIQAYQSANVKNAKQCVAEARTCANGSLSGTFGNSNCTVGESGGGKDDDDDIVKVCKLVVEIKHKEKTCDKIDEAHGHGVKHFKERYDCGKHKGWDKCEHYPGRSDCGKHLGWYKQSNWEDREKSGHNSGWYKELPTKSKKDK